MKGVIPHDSSNNDQVAERIIALLDSPQAQSTATAQVPSTAESSVGPDSSEDLEASSHLNPGSSNPEARDPSLPVPTPSTPSIPSSERPKHQDQASMNDSRPYQTSSRQSSREPATSESIAPSNEGNQSTNPPPKSTPQQLWTRIQRERERKEREERERIRAQIKHDHAERRRVDELRRQPAIDLTSTDSSHSSLKRTSSSEVRILVRTFDGSSLRALFPRSTSISGQVRPWIDSSAEQRTPYNLKIILTPQPNRMIEAAEEEKSLEDLDIVGSCTLVMVPIRGYVESYAPSSSGIIGSAVSGGFNLVSGSVGAILGGARSVLGFGQVASEPGEQPAPNEPSSESPSGHIRVRTLADQRIEAQKKEQQFYNGNQLNFQPRKDDDDEEKD